jgi:mevalonate kinase
MSIPGLVGLMVKMLAAGWLDPDTTTQHQIFLSVEAPLGAGLGSSASLSVALAACILRS